jgi:hypothetical protein
MPSNKKQSEFDKFDSAMRQLVSVPHDRVKAELDAEKRGKTKKRKPKKTSASGRASGGKG